MSRQRLTERRNPRGKEQRVNDRTTYDLNDKTQELDEEILGQIAGEILDARLEDEDQCLRERREEEG